MTDGQSSGFQNTGMTRSFFCAMSFITPWPNTEESLGQR